MPVVCHTAPTQSRRVAVIAAALVLLTILVPVAPRAVAAEGLPYLPVVTEPDVPADAAAVVPPPVAPAMDAPVAIAPPVTPAMDTPVAMSPPVAPVMDAPTDAPADAPVVGPPPPDDPPAPPVSVGVPKRIRIATAGIDANVEVVGLERDGSVGTPKNFDNTGWYEPGPRPGEPGNAVMVGHVDSAVLKRGAVFWNLRMVRPGDDITVTSDDGVEHHFTVTGQQQYNPQNVPIAQIFGQADGAHLNLITCDATTPFNRRTGEYGGWLLVTADAAP